MNYFLWFSGQEHGPYTLEEIQQSIAAGDINPQQTARREDSKVWKPIQQIAPLRSTASVAKQTTSVEQLQSAPTDSDSTTQKRLSTYLDFIRGHSSYEILRLVIYASTTLSILGFLIGGVILLAAEQGGGTAVGLMLIFIGIPLALAAQQSAVLVVDLADSFLHEHSKNHSRNA
jgi:hypothetical protein